MREGEKTVKSYVFDFEMTVYNQAELKTDLWLAYFEDLDSDKNKLLYKIDDVMDFILSQNGVNFYAHNSGGFDGVAIWDWLSNHNYVTIPKRSTKAKELDFFCIGNSAMFTIYTRQLDGELWSVSFIDTLRFINASIEELGKQVGIKKGNTPLIPYGTPYTATKEDIKYVKTDVRILKESMKRLRIAEIYENRMHSLSNFAYQTAISGESEIELSRIEDYEPCNLCAGWRGDRNKQKRYSKKTLAVVERVRKPPYPFKSKPTTITHLEECQIFIDDVIRKLDGALSEEERFKLERELEQAKEYKAHRHKLNQRIFYNEKTRLSYRGGLLYINRETQDKWIEDYGVIIDVNSRHPHTYSTEKLPKEFLRITYSSLEQMQEEMTDDFVYFVEFERLKAKVKDGRMPILKARKDDTLNYDLFQKHIPKEIDYKKVMMTQVDYEYMLENYDFEIAENPLFYPCSIHYELMDLLERHCDFWYNKKRTASAENDIFTYNQAKSMINNVTGFLAVNPDNFEPMGNKSSQSNIAVSSFINAHARVKLAEKMNCIGLDNIYYANTDSIHLRLPSHLQKKPTDKAKFKKQIVDWLEHEKGIEIDDIKLGAWKLEDVFSSAKYIAFMTYGYQSIDGAWKTKVTGLNKPVQKDDFELGTIITHLTPVRADGGILLINSDFVLGGKQYIEYLR